MPPNPSTVKPVKKEQLKEVDKINIYMSIAHFHLGLSRRDTKDSLESKEKAKRYAEKAEILLKRLETR